MSRATDFVVGRIRDLENSRDAGWLAFANKDFECEQLKKEVERLKKRRKK